MTGAITVKLPRLHAADWLARCGDDFGAEEVEGSPRTITLLLAPAALADLISDCRFYVQCMGPEDTGSPDEDYRPAARRCLTALERLGLR
jgi:hypothetical protein